MKLRVGNFIREQLRELARTCIDLAREEMAVFLRRLAREAKPLRGPAMSVALGLVLGFFAIAALVAAAILGLAQIIPAWGAALVVATVLALAALLLLRHVRHPSWTELKLLPPEPEAEPVEGVETPD